MDSLCVFHAYDESSNSSSAAVAVISHCFASYCFSGSIEGSISDVWKASPPNLRLSTMLVTAQTEHFDKEFRSGLWVLG